MATKRTTSTPTTSTIKREAMSAPKRSQRDDQSDTASRETPKAATSEPDRAQRESTGEMASREAAKSEAASVPKRSQRDGDVEIAPHEVARRAYEKYLERGGEHGNDVQDWLAAEAELRAGRD